MENSDTAIIAWLLKPEHLLLSAIIAGLVEAACRAGFPRNLTALLAIGLGFLGGIGYVLFFDGMGDPRSPVVGRALLAGIILGLMGSGVWGGIRDLMRVFTGQESISGEPLQERRAPRGDTDGDLRPPRAPGAPER